MTRQSAYWWEAKRMKLLVFLHGTTIMRRNAVGPTRSSRVRHVLQDDPTIRDFASYGPVGQAPDKLRAWMEQGADSSEQP